MKISKYILGLSLVATLLFASCSDFLDVDSRNTQTTDTFYKTEGQADQALTGLIGRAIDRPGMGVGSNALGHWRNMWRSEEEPGDGSTPSIFSSTTSSLYDTRWLYDSDFIKIKNITIGYQIPVRKYISYARVYASIENVYMWDKYDGGYSPESNNGGSGGDYDYGAYPQARTFSLGVNLTF